MSAFICHNSHVTALAVYAARNILLGWTDANQIGVMLQAENVKSVNYRYGEATEPDFEICEWAAFHGFSEVQILKAAHCLSYQSCEHPGWEESDACKLLESIIGETPADMSGYEEAAWEITPPANNEPTRPRIGSAAPFEIGGVMNSRISPGRPSRSRRRIDAMEKKTEGSEPHPAHRFSLGRVVLSPEVRSNSELTSEVLASYLSRHQAGDRGSASPDMFCLVDAFLFDEVHRVALAERRLFGSFYELPSVGEDGLWVITDTDRSVTTVLSMWEFRDLDSESLLEAVKAWDEQAGTSRS
jgi:hypothetical protein